MEVIYTKSTLEDHCDSRKIGICSCDESKSTFKICENALGKDAEYIELKGSLSEACMNNDTDSCKYIFNLVKLKLEDVSNKNDYT